MDPKRSWKKGDAIETIVEAAKQFSVDLIVIGTHGRGGIMRAILGSVAEGVMRHSDVPVVVVRSPHVDEPVAVAPSDQR